MKPITIRCLILSLMMILSQSNPLRAQFLKDLLNTAKQTAQGRANSKTAETTNKAMDKVDPSAAGKANSSSSGTKPSSNQQPADTAATNSVLGAFAKAAAENPNDTSSADLTMKALGLMASGGGVSAQDSVTAINSFKTASGGAGIHYAYRVTTSGQKIKTNRDTTQIEFTNKGEGRIEMRLPMPGVKTDPMISIGRIKARQYTVLLYPSSKTYLLNVIDTNLLKSRSTYQVTKIGTETVQGYTCTHARMVSTTGSGMFKFTTTTDIWTCPSVTGYSVFKSMINLHGSESGIYNALDNAGCGGLMVKMTVSGKDVSVEEELIRAEKSNFSADEFKIPAGYSESKENMFSHMAQSAKK